MTEETGPAGHDPGAAGGEAPPAAPSAEEELARLRAELERAQARIEELRSNWQRSQADHLNYRKRVEQERAEFQRYAAEQIIGDLVSVLDDFERAFATLPVELRQFTWLQGIDLIYLKMRSLLERHGLKPIEAIGQEFDPRLHQAIMQEEGDPAQNTHVVAEFQRGYWLHERVLRPALVKLGKPPVSGQPAPGTQGG